MLNNFSETYRPDNRFKCLCCDCECGDITIGGTVKHTFVFPFNFISYVDTCEIIYKQGIDKVFTITVPGEGDCKITVYPQTLTDNHHTVYYNDASTSIIDDARISLSTMGLKSVLTVTLSPEETKLFKNNYLNTMAQIKIATRQYDTLGIKSEIHFSSPKRIQVKKPTSIDGYID